MVVRAICTRQWQWRRHLQGRDPTSQSGMFGASGSCRTAQTARRLGGREVVEENARVGVKSPPPEMRVQQQSRRLRGCHALNRGQMVGNWEQQHRVTTKLLALEFLK